MKLNRRQLLAAAAATALVAGSGAALAQASDKTLNIGFFPVLSAVPIMQAQKQLEERAIP